SPGHAPHELTILDERNQCVYTGDAAGLYFPGDEILMPIAPAPSFDLEKNLETFRHLLALKPRALLFSHYGPHGKPKAAIEAMIALYPSWDRVVKERLASAGEDGVLRELYDMTCRAAKRFPRDFLERRIRVSIRGLAAYHERLEQVGPRRGGRDRRDRGGPHEQRVPPRPGGPRDDGPCDPGAAGPEGPGDARGNRPTDLGGPARDGD